MGSWEVLKCQWNGEDSAENTFRKRNSAMPRAIRIIYTDMITAGV